MVRDRVFKILSENHRVLKEYGIKDISLFGSVARGESQTDSDVDLLVEFEPSAQIGMFEFSRLRYELSQLLGCEVDLATPDSLHKDLKDNILREAIRAA
jgi:predicted nucleotidyltransferase